MVLSADSFNRANGALGSTDGAGTKDPLSWTVTSSSAGTAVWAIVSNKATTTTSFHAGFTVAVVDVTPSTDCMAQAACVNTSGNGGSCVIGRATNADNCWVAEQSLTGTFLYKRVAGAVTSIGTGSSTRPTNLGLLCRGNVITVIDADTGVVLLDAGSSPVTTTDTFNNTATKFGIGLNSDNNVGIDNWSVSPAGDTTVTGSQATETDTATSGTLFAVRSGLIQFIPAVTS